MSLVCLLCNKAVNDSVLCPRCLSCHRLLGVRFQKDDLLLVQAVDCKKTWCFKVTDSSVNKCSKQLVTVFVKKNCGNSVLWTEAFVTLNGESIVEHGTTIKESPSFVIRELLPLSRMQVRGMIQVQALQTTEVLWNIFAKSFQELNQDFHHRISGLSKELVEAREKSAQDLAEAREKSAQDLAEAREKSAREIAEAREKSAREIVEIKQQIHYTNQELKSTRSKVSEHQNLVKLGEKSLGAIESRQMSMESELQHQGNDINQLKRKRDTSTEGLNPLQKKEVRNEIHRLRR